MQCSRRIEALFAQFARIGLVRQRVRRLEAVASRPARVVARAEGRPGSRGFRHGTAATQRNGWTWAVGLDSFGFNYPLRALVAGPYLGGNGEQEAMYPLRYTNSTANC